MTTAKKTEKPILFSTEMTRAIIEGRKTVTRRVIKPQPDSKVNTVHPCKGGEWEFGEDYFNGDGEAIEYKTCPYFADELWVRETFALMKPHNRQLPSDYPEDCDVWYKADKEHHEPKALMGKWRPSIHMPRWVSRIQLKVEDIRVERVQEISYQDIRAEGLRPMTDVPSTDGQHVWENYLGNEHFIHDFGKGPTRSFQTLWDSINADRGYSWESNPFVWVVEFSIKNIKE